MKVILSRKGFDSSAGRAPSPILPDGRLVSLPIPESPAQQHAAIPYHDLEFEPGLSLAGLMKNLGINAPAGGAHLDPDLRPELHLETAEGWRGVMGQAGSAQRHLEKQGVGVGDLFLYFGPFRATTWCGKRLKWTPRARPRHVIWGYLQVGEVLPISVGLASDCPSWMRQHPHLRGPDRSFNTVYVAAPTLSFSPHSAGYGTFRYRPELCLSGGERTSDWRLPLCFHPDYCSQPLTYHSNVERWSTDGEEVTLRSARRGQEFVVEANDGILAWAQALIEAQS